MSLRLSSPSFADNAPIPLKFTCGGADVSPELVIVGVPENAKSLVLIVDDPDAPSKTWEHWTVINIPPDTVRIAEGSVPAGAVQLMNDFGRVEWGGPCPPPGKVHHYRFRLSALDTVLSLGSSAKKGDVVAAMNGHVLAESVLVGTYRR
ncbi:YbhB/YbcL family Raf kinase inhibitor-like protein [Candidatus Woesearchaeota archaeon]|nr:YbhB/YbcL family Raf kinase inhibitor-like protein [Candidatus Woesearchaeota archaeon]